jgi:hypothetical protein
LTYHESQEFIKAIDQFRTASEIEDFTRREMKKRLPEEFEAGER